MDRQSVDEYVAQSRQLVEASPRMDEENTKVRLVQPFLELLGWEFPSTEVELEYTVPMASTSTRVDYALLVQGSPAVFVEAKAVHKSLTEEPVEQLRSYMRQELDVRWGLLTNGESFEVFARHPEENGGREVSVVRLDLAELPEHRGMLELLSRRSIRSGRAEDTARKVVRASEAIRTVRDQEDRLVDAATAAIHDEIGELPIGVEQRSRGFVSELVERLQEHRRSLSEAPADDRDSDPRRSNADDLVASELDAFQQIGATDGGTRSVDGPGFGGDVERETGAASAASDRRGYAVSFSDGTTIPGDDGPRHLTQRRNMGAAIDYLIDEYDLIGKLELPFAPAGARERCTMSPEPCRPDGTELPQPYELVDGTYLYTLLGTEEKQDRLETLAERVELSVEWLGDWQSAPAPTLEEIVRSD